MKLAEYLKSTGLSPAKFGVLAGLSGPGVYLISKGKRHPRRKTMEKIIAATGGKVGAKDLFDGRA